MHAAAQEIVPAIWDEKYRHPTDKDLPDTFRRVARGLCEKDPRADFQAEVETALLEGRAVPAGRILSGAGTEKQVTLINCFVSPIIQDSMRTNPMFPGKGIMDALSDAAYTQQMGGGIGMNFSTIRPNGAVVKKTSSVSTGVLPFMDMWHSMCGTIKSSGSRRGAMMGTLAIWHPDILDFIVAKQTKGRLTNFNISVLVTDPFMEALEADADWDLYFNVPRADGQHVDVYEKGGETRYVYTRMKARELWDKIIENTYIHAEPGIIFIDRVNFWNNLHYCEDIQATNPCGEQPLPPDGDCNLGHANLAQMVRNIFTSAAKFDFDALRRTIKTMVRLLDNVIDVTLFPTEAQRLEAINKRRLGIGYTALGTALQMLRIRYGSTMAIQLTEEITREMCFAAYRESIELAKERGPFPAFDKEEYLKSEFVKKLPKDIQDGIRKHGIRNALLLSIAPTGTTSIIVGNVSSGIEPVVVLEGKRKVLQHDGTFKIYDCYDYGYLEYHDFMGAPVGTINLPEWLNCTIDDLTVDEHLQMQAAAQKWIDAAISKTVNAPESLSFEDFREVYRKAYNLGCKGCTTYRPDPRSYRGAVITKKEDKSPVQKIFDKVPMQEITEGRRYYVKWPGLDQAYYVQMNDYIDENGVRRPFEIFISSKDVGHDEWVKALTLMMTAIFRRGGDVTFVVHELKQVFSARGGAFFNKSYAGSIVAAIGMKIEEHFRWLGLIAPEESFVMEPILLEAQPSTQAHPQCPKCAAPTLRRVEGCSKCDSCGFSTCG